MSKIYSPKIVTDGLVMCLDASQNKSYPTIDLPVKNGLALWLDAADDTTFSYSSGTSVSQWRDKSGNNRHFFQSTAGNQPSRSAVVNSRKAIQFTAASSNYLRFNSTIINNRTGGSVFVVWRTAGETSQYSQILDNYHGGANAQYAGFSIERNSTNNQYYWGFQDTGFTPAGNIGSTAYSNDTTYCYWITKDSTTITGGYNGTSVTPVPSPSSTWTEDTKGWLIGSWGSNTETFSRFFNGIQCEIIIFNRGLSAREVKQVNTYLGQKWGISNTDRSIVNLADSSKNGLLGNGTTANMPLIDYYNKGSLKFDGSNDYVNIGVGTGLNQFSGDFTVSLWAMATGLNSNYGNLIGDYYTNTVATTNEWQIMMNNSSTYLNVYRVGTGYIISNTASGFSTNTWINVVLTRIGSAVTLYANNTVIATATNSTTFGTATGNFNIGIDGNNTSEPFSGLISNVLIYQKGLSAAEVARNYETQKSRFANTIVQQGLVLNLDAGNPYSYAGAGTTWYDTSGAVNDFTIANSPTYSANEFVLNGSTQFFYNTSAASGFFVSSTNNFYADVGYAWTISVWFKFPVSPTNLRDGTNNGGNCSYCMVGNGGGIGGAETLALFVSGVNGTTAGYHPYYCIVGIRGAKTQLSAGSVNTNTWNHALVTWNGSVGRGYFNGVDVGALNIGSAGMQINGYTIGTQVGGNQGSHTYEGSLSQVFIYNRALSAAEALQNYNATKGRFGL